MHLISDLWLPIVLSGVAVFIVSSVLHMVLPIHRGDHQPLPGEPEILEAIRKQNVAPGAYMFPFPSSMKDMGSPEMLAKYNQGPVGWLTVLPNGPPAMGKSLIAWFVFSLIVSVFSGYLAMIGLEAGSPFLIVFRVTSTAAILGYAIGEIPNSVWKGVSWTTTMKFVFDGFIYGIVTGLIFAALWP